MTIGDLSSAYAYEVAPKQNEKFLGGSVDGLNELSTGLIEAARVARLGEAPHFNLRVDASRKSVVRDALMAIAGSDEPTSSEDAARLLAAKLGNSMDNRSHPCLLIVSVHVGPASIATWMFPKENVIQRSGDSISINEAFSLSSYLRKAALFDRTSTLQNSFLSARIVDKQSSTGAASAAKFWTDQFIEAAPQLTAVRGTKLMAEVLREVNTLLDGDPSQRQALHTAVSMTRSRGTHRFSIAKFVNQDLPVGAARDVVSKVSGDRGLGSAEFELDPTTFDQAIKFQIFNLSNGVQVTIPFAADLPSDVTVDGNHLTVSGEIESSKLRGRRP